VTEPSPAEPAGPSPSGRGLPRAADLMIAAIALVIASPLLLAAALAIKLGSRGPVIYRQPRVGQHGRVFDLFKLRTMRKGADPIGVGTAVIADDPRVTRVGRLLRRFALDELPNLANVLRGEMAMVGPRATLPAQVALYTPRQKRRLELRPGVTGWAQTHGRAGIPWEERIELDVWYVEHRSPALDLRILAMTPLVLLRGQGMISPDPYAGSSPDSPLRQAAEREQARQPHE
jgi:lipopolysaccharide/colanic/teichoic acid biosynthesis glycosyltransferase